MVKKLIRVHDKMQKGYEYELSVPEGKEFDPRFKPELTPKQLLELGVFGGKYMTDCTKEFPENWYKYARLSSRMRDSKLNYFGVNASQSLDVWRKKGWIYKDDPRGWFEWYCKYFLGRRHEDDERQIKRWLAFCGPKGRWRNIIYKKIFNAGCKVDFSWNISRRIQQSLLHWSYVVNEEDYENWKNSIAK